MRRAAGGGSRDEDPVCAAGRGWSGALSLPGLPTTSPIPVAPPTPLCLAALPAYSDHPLHQAVVKEHILPLKEDILALDYIA